jgi:phosphatidylserine decarboxylase
LSVGRIVQVHPLDKPFQRGEEKSVFRFGGSAIAVFGQAGRWCPSADVLENTAKGIETMLRLGEEVAHQSASTAENVSMPSRSGFDGKRSTDQEV